MRALKKIIGGMLRTHLRCLGAGLYHLGLTDFIIALSPNRLRTLLYHSTDTTPDAHIEGMNVNVAPETLAIHLDYVKKHYSVVSIDDVTHGLYGPSPLVITFDDGYKSVETQAVPLLEARDLPATVYLIGTAVIGNMVWVNELNYALVTHTAKIAEILSDYPELEGLDREGVIQAVQNSFSPSEIELLMYRIENELPAKAACPQLFSDADGVRRMRQRGISFGFHTRDHYNLRNCGPAMLERQLNPRFIQSLLNSNTFAYPFGYFTDIAIHSLESYGYEALMTVSDNSTSASLLHRDRSEVRATSAALMFAQLEIEEPVMAFLHRVKRWLTRPIKLGFPALLSPETSKPR